MPGLRVLMYVCMWLMLYGKRCDVGIFTGFEIVILSPLRNLAPAANGSCSNIDLSISSRMFSYNQRT